MSLSKGEPMRWIHSTFGYLMSAVALLLLVACGDIPTSESRSNPSEEPVTISLRLGDENAQTGRFKGTFGDVSSVTLNYGDGDPLCCSVPLSKFGNIFSGEVNDLTVGSSYDFTATAWNSSDVALFEGSVNGFTISTGNNFLQLRMSPIEDSAEQIQIPRISRVYYNKNMLPETDYQIQIEVEAAFNDNISYQLTVDNGTFQSGASVQNQQIFTKYTTFPVTYTTPNDNNTTVNFTLSVTNSQNYTVASNFSATVSNKLELEPGIIFNPVVLSLEGERYENSNNVNWIVIVNDEGQSSNLLAEFKYYSGVNSSIYTYQSHPYYTYPSSDNVTFSANLPYFSSENGTLEVRIFNDSAGDNVTVTWPVAVNQFPDTVTVNALSSGVSRIATGPAHSCVVVDNGTNLKVADNSSIPGGDNGSIYCWGVNAQYQLGNNASGSDNQTEPVLVDNVTFTGQLVSVTAADNFTCGLDNESEVKCWGSNLPPNLTGSGIDNRSLQMDAGGESLCAVLDNSSLACVGSDNLTTGIPAGSFKQVSVGDNLTHPAACAIAENNTVNCWGEGTNQIITGAQLDNATQVAVGTNHACAVRMDGLVKCWGDNTRGQLGNNTNGHYVQQYNGYNLGDLTDVVYVSVGARHTCAVRSNGTMRCWGDRANGKIGNNTDEDGVDSTASFLGGSFTNAVQMALGHEHTCVLLENPADPKLEVLCWGLGDGGRLGLGDNETRLMP